jgi:hypothetical protein
VASKGSSRHQRHVEQFSEAADKTADDARHDGSCAEIEAMAAQVSSPAQQLQAWVLIGGGEAESSKYQAVADAGSRLMKQLGNDQEFDTPGLP